MQKSKSTYIWPTHVLHLFVVHMQIFDRRSRTIFRKVSNTFIRKMFACKYAEKCQMQIETYQMHIFSEHSNAYIQWTLKCICRSLNTYISVVCIFANMHKSYYNKCSHRICRTVSNAYIWWKLICKYKEKMSNVKNWLLFAWSIKCIWQIFICKYAEVSKWQTLMQIYRKVSIFVHYTL